MNEIIGNLIEKTGNLLSSIANTLGTTAVHIYGVLVRQQFIEGIIGAVSTLSMFLGAFFFTKLLDNILSKKYPNNYSIEDRLLVWSFSIFVSLFVLSKTLPVLGYSINKAINPEYYAIVKIFEEVKK